VTAARCYRKACDIAVREIPKSANENARLEVTARLLTEWPRRWHIHIREIPEERIREVTYTLVV